MKIRQWFLLFCGMAVVSAAFAQAPKKRVERADDLPRFSYKVDGELEAIVRDPQKFSALARQVYADTEGVLAQYDIAERAMRRQLLSVLMMVDLLEGRNDKALPLSAQIRELQERPADKLLSGITVRAIVAAQKKLGSRDAPGYAAEVARLVNEELAAHPYETIRNNVMGMKAGMETLGESIVLGRVRDMLQPVATRTGSLSSDLAPALISARYSLVFSLPVKAALADALGGYLASRKADKPDIWAKRDVALPDGMGLRPVTVVVWDSGVDSQLFSGRWATEGGQPAFIAFDSQERSSRSVLKPIPAQLKERLPVLQSRSKGLSDLQSNIDSAEAGEVKKLLSGLPPTQYKGVIEELRMTSVYQHGTHVAGIAMAGNPYARIANARIEFGHTLIPDPCPTPELEALGAANMAAYGDFIRKVGARVVNMSWGGDLRSDEVALEQCGIGKDAAERRTIARKFFDEKRAALTKMMASLPDVLFVAAAGNSGNDPTFNDIYPSGIVLPNLVVVGAVDKAGDEASFTSYGQTVALHANGYQVESFVPGGTRVAFSGTSMAAPQVANLAAKLVAVKPSLKPTEVIAIMRGTAERSEDGRRTLVHPAKALASIGYSPQ